MPYMQSKLSPIDWRQVIKEEELFTDPYFKAHRDSIVDPMIQRDKRIHQWETFIWKRPSEVYGKDNYSVFNDISPNDII